jgi:GNAT superfamily N-acetyltransferase
MSADQQARITLRKATPADAPICGQICYDAFFAINQKHGFPCDFPEPAVPVGLLSMVFGSPDFYCVVAELDGKVVGSNCLDERSAIFGIGPITVDLGTQNSGIGRKLMQAVIDRANKKSAAGIRLVQAGFHTRSLSLYASMGFDVREHLACMQGNALKRSVDGCNVRPAESGDIAACRDLSLRVHGFDRSNELPGAIQHGTARVVERQGRITGYTSDLAFFGHTVGETNLDLKALIAASESFGGPGFLLPTRNSSLFRWCLDNGLRVVQPMTLMSMGLYNEPPGAWLPSILY